MLLGIIDNDKLKDINISEPIEEFSDDQYEGYSVWLASSPSKYHASEKHCGSFEYLAQYDPKKIHTITMVLDMTQNECENGLLSYFVEGEKKNAGSNTPSNIAFDNIDPDKEYRMAICTREVGAKLGLLQS